jgi:hypothetical protein
LPCDLAEFADACARLEGEPEQEMRAAVLW